LRALGDRVSLLVILIDRLSSGRVGYEFIEAGSPYFHGRIEFMERRRFL
jgi:hypothetical protein